MYDYIITKPPLNEETLAHYGIKGMKWGKVKDRVKSGLKWQASKVKNKALEAKTKRNRKKTTVDASEVTYGNGKLSPGSRMRAFKKVYGYDEIPTAYAGSYNKSTRDAIESRGHSKVAARQTMNSKQVQNGTEAGRERVAAEKKKKKK